MSVKIKTSMLFAFSLLLSAPVSAAVLDDATYTIEWGWNAIYMPVTPTNTADEVFADWPTDKVGFYDQMAFLRTKQFDDEDSTLGAVDNAMKMWYRDEPGKSTLKRPVANGIYIFQSTNEDSVVRTVRGVPAAMRTSWHVSVSTNQPLNFVGISTDGAQAELTEEGYFRGLDTGWTYAKSFVGNVSTSSDEEPFLDFYHSKTPTKGNLGVVAMDAPKVSDWSGSLFVSPLVGVQFGTNLCTSALTVCNEGGTNRSVRVSLRQSKNALPVPAILCRNEAGEWVDFAAGDSIDFNLLPLATKTLRFAVDRSQFSGVAAGTQYGAILDVNDVSDTNPSHFHTAVPLSVLSDGGSYMETGWPMGLWTVDLNLDKVGDKRAGSTMTARVLVHVDKNGNMNLMQRALVGERRVSSVVLPSDISASRGMVDTNNVFAAGDGTVTTGSGTFGSDAAFKWTVSDKSRINPYRHAKHPDHDGLDWDFKDTLPSGDNFTNYVAAVKPELFSISNRLEMVWSAHEGSAWNPEESLDGTCTWWLFGLRHEGGIKTGGTFQMRRISEDDLEAIKEEL